MSKLERYPKSGNLVDRDPLVDALNRTFYEATNWINDGYINAEDGFKWLDALGLYELGRRILGVSSVWEAYDILAEVGESGSCYYDLVIGPQHRRGLEVLLAALAGLERSKVRSGLDIGAGTGNSTVVLASRCESVVAIDLSAALLAQAKVKLERLKTGGSIRSYRAEEMDALDLRLPDGEFDIVLTHGIDSYFTLDELAELFKGINRVLAPGGRYYKYCACIPEDHPVYQVSPRAALAGVVAKALLSFTYAPFYASLQDGPSCLDSEAEGFDRRTIFINNPAFPDEIIIRWIKKPV